MMPRLRVYNFVVRVGRMKASMDGRETGGRVVGYIFSITSL
jgi:hypothetical protein